MTAEGRNTMTTAVANQIEEAAWRSAGSLNCEALRRHQGGKGRTAHAPRGEGRGGQRALRRVRSPHALSSLMAMQRAKAQQDTTTKTKMVTGDDDDDDGDSAMGDKVDDDGNDDNYGNGRQQQ